MYLLLLHIFLSMFLIDFLGSKTYEVFTWDSRDQLPATEGNIQLDGAMVWISI